MKRTWRIFFAIAAMINHVALPLTKWYSGLIIHQDN